MTLDLKNNNYRQNFIFAITFFILIFLMCPGAFGVLPPKVYKEAAQSSIIKAIAIVKKVKILDETNRSTFKQVLFKLEKSLTRGLLQKKVPQEFSGSCYSVDHKWQDPGYGGTIHYYPSKGARVFVTVSSDGGSITSYTTLSPAFEEELNKNGLKNIEFGMGHAYIKKSAMSPASKREMKAEAFASSGRWYYFTAKNYQKAFQEFKKAVRLGHVDSQNYLGNLYFNGLGVEQDFQKALEWYEKSAEQNNARGIYGLGVMGKNIALNIANKGFLVSVCNRNEGEECNIVQDFITTERQSNIEGYANIEEFVLSLEKPRKVLIMITAGLAVDEIILQLMK